MRLESRATYTEEATDPNDPLTTPTQIPSALDVAPAGLVVRLRQTYMSPGRRSGPRRGVAKSGSRTSTEYRLGVILAPSGPVSLDWLEVIIRFTPVPLPNLVRLCPVGALVVLLACEQHNEADANFTVNAISNIQNSIPYSLASTTCRVLTIKVLGNNRLHCRPPWTRKRELPKVYRNSSQQRIRAFVI